MPKTSVQPIVIHHFSSPVGELILGSYQQKLCLCDWRYRRKRDEIDQRITSTLNSHFTKGTNAIIAQTIEQLNDYFQGDRTTFDVPLEMVGSDFQKRVWNALMKIPYGKTNTYLELTRKIGDAKAIRAVANANGANAISILVPCHRIIGSDGSLTGYAGGLNVKEKLLNLENVQQQLSLF